MRKYRLLQIFLLCLFCASLQAISQVLPPEKASEVAKINSLSRTSKSDTARISAQIRIAEIYASSKIIDSSMIALDNALKLFHNAIKRPTNRSLSEYLHNQHLNILLKKGESLRRLGRVADATSTLQECLDIAEKTNNQRAKAWAIQLLGEVYDFVGNYDQALVFFLNSLELFEQIPDSIGIGKCLNSIGTIYDYQGDLDNGLKYYTKSLEVHQSIGDKKGVAERYNNIGVIYYFKGDNEKSLDYYQPCVQSY